MHRISAALLALALAFSLTACGSAPKESKAETPPQEMLDAAQLCDTLDTYCTEVEEILAPVIGGIDTAKNYTGMQLDYVLNETMGAALDAKDAIRAIHEATKEIAAQTEDTEGLEEYLDTFKDFLGCALTYTDKVKAYCKDPTRENAEVYTHSFDVYLASKINYADAQLKYLLNYYTIEELTE